MSECWLAGDFGLWVGDGGGAEPCSGCMLFIMRELAGSGSEERPTGMQLANRNEHSSRQQV
jgi:hypothetical protein